MITQIYLYRNHIMFNQNGLNQDDSIKVIMSQAYKKLKLLKQKRKQG